MNLTNQKVQGEDNIIIFDSLNTILTSIKISPKEGIIVPDNNELIISVGDKNSGLLMEDAKIKNYVYNLSNSLFYGEDNYGEFYQEIRVVNNEIKSYAYIDWSTNEGSFIEELEPLDIMLFDGYNNIYTNYQNVDIEIVYPKNDNISKSFLNTGIYMGHIKQNQDLSLDDLYFKDAFTKTGDELNEEIDNLNVKCITSKNNKFSLDSEGNLVVNSITTNSNSASQPSMSQDNIRDFIYPVGSIYMSVNNVSPESLFGGSWQQLKDRFLLASGDIYSNGTLGGESSHTLLSSELPKHSHGIPALTGSTNGAGAHSHSVNGTSANNGGSGVLCETWANKSNDRNGSTSSVANHAHTVTTNSSTTNETGANTPHNNMPPYIAVNMWKRIS